MPKINKRRNKYKEVSEDREEVSDWTELQQEAEKTFTIKNKFNFNEVHKSFLELCLYDKSKMVFVDGSAGTAKTYIAVLAGLTLLKEKKIDHIVYIRSIVESATKSIGALPGEIDEKFKPWSLPMLEKMHEMMSPAQANKLITQGTVRCVPVNFVRGLTFHDSLVIIDESQNLTKDELVTILTRFGHNTKYVVVGDSQQRDIGYQSGFREIFSKFEDEESAENGIHVMKFSENEIVRSQILRFIVRKLGC